MKLMQNSYGYTVALTTNLDLTSATVIRVRLTAPAASGLGVLDKHLTHNDVASGATGVVTLPINPGDLPVPGYYRIEAFDETPNRRVISTVGSVEVDATLDTDSSDVSGWVSTPDLPLPGVVTDHANGLAVAGNVDAASFTVGGEPLVLFPGVRPDGLTPGGLTIDGGLRSGSLFASTPTPPVGGSPDPTYNPTYTFSDADRAAESSDWGEALVHFFPWTPTRSGSVTLLAPEDDGASQSIEYQVWLGTTAGVDVPALDGSGSSPESLCNASAHWSDVNRGGTLERWSDSFTVTAGDTYTLGIVQWPDSDNSLPSGRTMSLRPWVQSTQAFGGQSHAVSLPSPEASGEFSVAEGIGAASGYSAHAEGVFSIASGLGSHAEGGSSIASGRFAHAEALGVASAWSAHAEGAGLASSPFSHAEGGNSIASAAGAHAEGVETTASGGSAHAEGSESTASGSAAHAEGSGSTASGDEAHAEGFDTVASGDSAHAEGQSTTASGFCSHAQGHNTLASGVFSDVIGKHAIAALPSEHAHSSHVLSSGIEGGAQYSRLVPVAETTDATPVLMLLDAEGSNVGLALGTKQAWQVSIQVVASRRDTPGTTAGWHLSALVTSTGTPRIVGTPTVISHQNDAAASAWDVALSVDTVTDPSNPALAITVTGQAAQTIYWMGTVHASRVAV